MLFLFKNGFFQNFRQKRLRSYSNFKVKNRPLIYVLFTFNIQNYTYYLIFPIRMHNLRIYFKSPFAYIQNGVLYICAFVKIILIQALHFIRSEKVMQYKTSINALITKIHVIKVQFILTGKKYMLNVSIIRTYIECMMHCCRL